MAETTTETTTPTWKVMAVVYPQFVQWVVQKYGPRPEGAIVREDWDRYVALYESQP